MRLLLSRAWAPAEVFETKNYPRSTDYSDDEVSISLGLVLVGTPSSYAYLGYYISSFDT